MNPLVLKVTLAPSLVALVSVVVRRWGSRVGGWVTAFPIIGGPILFFFAEEQGAPFAAQAATGTVQGVVSLVLYCVVYARVAPRASWAPTLLAGWLAFAASTLALRQFRWSVAMALASAACAIAAALFVVPQPPPSASGSPKPPDSLLPRMLAAAALVLLITEAAHRLGPELSGLLTPFPIASTVLVVFSHAYEGSAETVRLIRGFLTGLFSFALFCAVVAGTIVPWGIAASFGGAFAASLATQVVAFFVTSRKAPSAA